ncbi:MAG: sensor histidine kinase [Suipraeoptans sp.]
MNKQKIFSEQLICFARIIITMESFLFMVIFIAMKVKNIIDVQGMMIGFVLTVFIHLLIATYLKKKIIIPYEESRQVYKKFVNGMVYDDLFNLDYQMFPEMKEVMTRFGNMIDKQSSIKLSTKQAEYLALQNQINPHFLYNTLEAIRGEALSVGQEDIADITQALAKFFRYTISDVGHLVTLEDELDNAENYFKIQEYRFGTKIKMNVELPKEDALGFQLPKLTLQPIIENAIFHGLEKSSGKGSVNILVELTKDKLFIQVSDDGGGIPEDELEVLNNKLERVSASYVNEKKGRGGIALLNVCRRIKLLFGEEYGISVYSLYSVGTDVRIVMPLLRLRSDEI